MWILKEHNDNEGNLKSVEVQMEIGEIKNNIINSLKKTNPNVIVNFIPNKIHINQYDNIYLHRGNFDKTKDIYIPKIRKNPTKTILEKSVQCRGISGDPFPVSHSRRCLNKTKNPNGLCYLHKYQDTNTINGVHIGPHTLKYWKD